MYFRVPRSANELSDGEIKRKKLAAYSSVQQTGSQTALAHIDEEANSSVEATATALAPPVDVADVVLSEHYWRDQAEAHRVELERQLRQNEMLHGDVRRLKMSLDKANQQLDDSKELVEVLTEMLEEDDEESASATDGTDALSMEVATSADESSTPDDSSAVAENLSASVEK